MINWDRVNKTLDYMKDHPGEVGMAAYFDPQGWKGCGSTACFAGHLLLQNGWQIEQSLITVGNHEQWGRPVLTDPQGNSFEEDRSHPDGRNIHTIAAGIANFDVEQAHTLFISSGSEQEVRNYLAYYKDQEEETVEAQGGD